MKKTEILCFWALVFMLLICLLPLNILGQEYYQKGHYGLYRSLYIDSFINGIDIKGLNDNHLQDFETISVGALWYTGKSYRFKNSKNEELIITLGVYPSIQEVEETVLDYMNSISAAFEKGPFEDISIGDNFWWYDITLYRNQIAEKKLSSVVFIRKNVLIVLHSPVSSKKIKYFSNMLDVAMNIDNDLINGSTYIKINDVLTPPAIQSVTLSKNKILEGEESLMTINASDPSGHIAHYLMTPGPSKDGRDPVNVYRIQANRDKFPEPFLGKHTIEVWIVNNDNFFSSKESVEVTILDSSAVVSEGTSAEALHAFTMTQNSPNPFNAGTAIGYELRQASALSLRIFDMLGREVSVLEQGERSGGAYTAFWDGRDSSGMPVSSGVYFYRLETGGQAETRRMTLAR